MQSNFGLRGEGQLRVRLMRRHEFSVCSAHPVILSRLSLVHRRATLDMKLHVACRTTEYKWRSGQGQGVQSSQNET